MDCHDGGRSMTKRWRLIVVSALCGLGWGAILRFLVLGAAERALGSGWLLSPFIGIVAGQIAVRFDGADVTEMAVASLISLYLTATLYGIGTSVTLSFFDLRHPIPNLMTALIFPFTMTVGGYLLWMWPLAYLNHRLVARLAS
jgi:hypothetical protein